MAGGDSEDHTRARRRPGRAPTSCAECRRLKLRCDRKVPCATCVKRKCDSICPDGCLTSIKGSRLILANTEELHEQIQRLQNRVQELEAALSTLQARVADGPHPLLVHRDQSPESDVPAARVRHQNSHTPPSGSASPMLDEGDNLVDNFGTLTIGPSGEMEFFGRTARSDYLVQASQSKPDAFPGMLPHISDRMQRAFKNLSHSSVDIEIGPEVMGLLPPLPDALKMCDIYLEHGRYLWTPITREELVDEIIPNTYSTKSFESQDKHTLSLLFCIFSLAALMDETRPAFSVEAHEFYIISCVVFSFLLSCQQTTTRSIQALVHMSYYLDLSDIEEKGCAMAWLRAGHAVTTSHMIGLHTSSARWKFPKAVSEKRSRTFWIVYHLDTWLSFSCGRPPNISPAYIDCALPEDLDEHVDDDGKKQMGFHMWTWRYTSLLQKVISTAWGATIPPYESIIELDRQVREFHVPPHLRPSQVDLAPWVAMQKWTVLSSKETTLLHLHRSYFAQALNDKPHDLTTHKYGPSVMAAYRSAWRLIEGIQCPMNNAAPLIARSALAWSQVLSAAIVMCLLATRAPWSKLTKSGLEQLDRLLELVEEAAPTSKPAAQNLDAVQRLQRKAHEAADFSQTHMPTAALSPAELDRLGGKTHLISRRSRSSGPSSSPSSYSNGASSTYAPDFSAIHPTIVQDMRIFDGLDFSNMNAIFDYPMTDVPEAPPQPTYGLGHGPLHLGDQVQQQPQPSDFYLSGPGYDPLSLDSAWNAFVEQLGF